MPKQGEIDYLKNIHPLSVEQARTKPFSDPRCSRHLMDLGMIMSLLPDHWIRILDIGVGTGWTSLFYAKRGYGVVGQDIAPDMIALANENKVREGLTNVDFVVGDFEEMPFRDEFDVAIFYDSLHHAVDEAAALAKAYAALKPGGMCITVEPGEGHSQDPLAQAAIAEYGVTEKDMPPHHIMQLGQQIGFRDCKVYQRHYEAEVIYPVKSPSEPPTLTRRQLTMTYLKQAWQVWRYGVPAANQVNDPFPVSIRASNMVSMIKGL